MICTSVIPVAWLKIIKLCPSLTYFPGFFGHFESLAIFENGANLTSNVNVTGKLCFHYKDFIGNQSGPEKVSAGRRCPLYRMSAIERFHCVHFAYVYYAAVMYAF